MYSVCTVTYCLLGGVWLLCHMKYYAGGSICTWTAGVLSLCQMKYGFLNGTVTKHGSTGLDRSLAVLSLIALDLCSI